MSAPQTKYRVVVFAAPENRMELAETLQDTLSLLPPDAAIQSRLLPGIVQGEFSAEAAGRAAAAIDSMGYHAEAIPAAEIPALHPCDVPHHLRWPESGLQVIDPRGEIATAIPWEDVDLISVGQVPLESSRHNTSRPATVVSTGRHHIPDVDFTSRPAAGPEAYIVCKNPRRVYRLDHKRLNYEFLGEGLAESATTNFRLFLAELVAQAKSAYLPPWTTSYLAGDHVGRFEFPSPAELERATVLHLLIRRRSKTDPI